MIRKALAGAFIDVLKGMPDHFMALKVCTTTLDASWKLRPGLSQAVCVIEGEDGPSMTVPFPSLQKEVWSLQSYLAVKEYELKSAQPVKM